MSESRFITDIDHLPRFARLTFLCGCAERIAALYTARWMRPSALRYQSDIYKGLEKLSAFIRRPTLVSTRADLERAEHAVGVAVIAAADQNPRSGSSLVAHIVEAIMQLALNEASGERCSDIAGPAFTLMLQGCCDRDGLLDPHSTLLVEKTMQNDFDEIRAASEKQQLDNRNPLLWLRSGEMWPFGKPPKWPNEAILTGAIELMNGHGLSEVLKLFKQLIP